MNDQADNKTSNTKPKQMKKKPLKKRAMKWIALNVVPTLAYKWMTWFDRTALANNEKLLTLINPEELMERYASDDKISIVAIWHSRLIFGPTGMNYMKGKGSGIMVSRSLDGEVISAVLKKFPSFIPVRGSSSKKGKDKGGQEALLELIKLGLSGNNMVITPDGPQGPRGKAKRGVIELAKATGAPVFCVGCNASKWIEAKTWDKTRIPFPYAKFIYKIADPIYVDKDADDMEMEEKRKMVENKLNELMDFADHFFDED